MSSGNYQRRLHSGNQLNDAARFGGGSSSRGEPKVPLFSSKSNYYPNKVNPTQFLQVKKSASNLALSQYSNQTPKQQSTSTGKRRQSDYSR